MSKMKMAAVVATVSIIGFAAGALAAPFAYSVPYTINECLSTGGANSIENVIKAATCPTFQAILGIPPTACDGITDSWIRKVPVAECASSWRATTNGLFHGDWQPN